MKKLFALILGTICVYQSNGQAANFLGDAVTQFLNPGQYYIDKLCGSGSNTVYFEYTEPEISDFVGLTAAGWEIDRRYSRSASLENAIPEFHRSRFVTYETEGNSFVGVKLLDVRTNQLEVQPLGKIVKRINAPAVKKVFYCLDNTGSQIYMRQGQMLMCELKGCDSELEAKKQVTYRHQTNIEIMHRDLLVVGYQSLGFSHEGSHSGRLESALSTEK